MRVNSEGAKSADDAKYLRFVRDTEDCKELQRDLARLMALEQEA